MTSIGLIVLTTNRSVLFLKSVLQMRKLRIHTVFKSVKNCQWSVILPYLKASKLACLFHQSLQKTGDFWVRNKGLYYSQH